MALRLPRNLARCSFAATAALFVCHLSFAASAKLASEQAQYFETKVRPILVKNCYGCHTELKSGGLRLDTAEGMLKGGKDGAVIVPGHPAESLLIKAIHYHESLRMPPQGALGSAEVAVIEQWVADGAFWPTDSPKIDTSVVSSADRKFWSFEPPAPAKVPAINSPWVRNDVDRFVLAKLSEKGLKPVGDSDKRALLRRVTYDLTGLPPTQAEVEAFLADRSPTAYSKVVDRLLSSKAYGERWGRIWLDVVRYADTTGNNADYPVPEAYKYRDWVIQSISQDKPYDVFIKNQIAGDLLPSKSEEEHWQNTIATGYLAIARRTGDAPDENLVQSDAVDNLGYAYLGLTVACARCHDHKFDPIPTKDYYGLYSILASSRFPHPGAETKRFPTGYVYRHPKDLEAQSYKDFDEQITAVGNAITEVRKLNLFDELLPPLEKRRMEIMATEPKLERAYAVSEGTPVESRVQHYGDPKDLGDAAPRTTLQVLGGGKLSKNTAGSGRLELANWIASAQNPLTARVMVNRIWLAHFGSGIVPTPNDFGHRGTLPVNAELLDYLAGRFVQDNWSIKSMHRLILLSHAYQLSSDDDPASEAKDPDNLYTWRHSRMRLDAEEVRDSLLITSGKLDRTPPVAHPFPQAGKWNYTLDNPFSALYDTDRRTVYLMVQRSKRHPYLDIFDGADANLSTPQRDGSVTPLQALYLLNADFPRQCADTLTQTLDSQVPNVRDRIIATVERIYQRKPSIAEIAKIQAFLAQSSQSFAGHGTKPNEADEKAFRLFVEALYSSNEFMILD